MSGASRADGAPPPAIAVRAARGIRSLVLGLVLAAATVAGMSVHRVADLTAEHSLSLTASTRRVLADLDRDVAITAFLRRDEPGRVEAAALLTRYRRESPRLRVTILDPDESPGEVARLGVDPIFGGVALAAGEDVTQVPTVTEQDLTAGLARLVRGLDAEVCITTGHGEAALVRAAALLEREGYTVRVLDLLAEPSIPSTCTAVVVPGPTAPLGPAGVAVERWLADDGRLLLLGDPASTVELAPLLEPLGLGVRRGVVFEGDADAVVNADVTAPIVRTYSAGHPVVRRLAPTYFPGVQALEVDDAVVASTPGLVVSRLADTSPASYLETSPVSPTFDPASDAAGPLTVAAAAEQSRNDGSRIHRTRLVVVGDVEFATDRFVDQAANGDLFVRAVAWLTLDDELLAISANLPAERPLALTDGRLAYARVLTVGVVPALWLLAGAMTWAVRRSR